MRIYALHAIMRSSRKKCYMVLFLGVVVYIVYYIYYGRNRQPYTGTKSQLFLSVFGEKPLPDPTQDDIDYFAAHVIVKYDVIDNFGDDFFLGGYTFINTGNRPIPAKRWQLYFYSMRLVEKHDYPYPYGFYLSGCGLKVFHFSGQLYWFEPVAGYFKGLQPSSSMTCEIKHYNTQVARSDSMPNWYVVGNDLLPKIIENTRGEDLAYVGDFTRPNQYLRTPEETDHPYSPAERYDVYHPSVEKVTNPGKVLPTPLEINLNEKETLEWNRNVWAVLSPGPFPAEAKYLADKLKMKITAVRPAKHYVEFIKKDVDVSKYNAIQEEAYMLTSRFDKQAIYITSGTEKGAFNAIQSLMSLLFTPQAGAENGIVGLLPSFTVTDAPRFSYRGLHIDVARNFHGLGQMKKVMEAMAMYKMNKLHLHLSDDEGWRLEIPGMPELIQIGSKRCHDPEEEQCLMPMLGSGPHANTSGTGYFDVGSYKDLLRFASSHHIEVIPEIDMPGHSRAAIRSIHAKSQKSHRSAMKAEIYDIIDESDTGVVHSVQGAKGNTINPCMPETYKFVNNIMTSLREMHKDVQPLKLFHFGGDEVPQGSWTSSKICNSTASQQPEMSSHFGKMKYFVQRVTESAAGLSLSAGCWEDGVIAHPQVKDDEPPLGMPFPRDHFKNKDILVYVWKQPRLTLTPHRLRLLANYGYKVILAYGSHFYFDHPYEADPEERGLYWAARKVSLQDVWGFSTKISEQDLDLGCPAEIKDQTDCFKLKKPENIIGLQAEVWTETIRTEEQMDYMLFPRLLAVAERAWHKSAWEDGEPASQDKQTKVLEYAAFVNLVGSKELSRLESLGIRYRVPPPGARVEEGKVSFRTEFPGLDIEYFADGEDKWKTVSHNMPITRPIKIRTRSFDGKRYSRAITVRPEKSPKFVDYD